MFFKHPLYDWKNLTTNPNILIRRDIMKVASTLPAFKSTVDTIKEHGKSLEKAISKIASLSIAIKNKESDLKKAESDEIKNKLEKEVKSLLKKKESITKRNKGIEADFVKNAADTFLEFDELIDTFLTLNMQPLTLIHRARRDIDNLIDKVKALTHEQLVELEKLKMQSITKLNTEKEHLKKIADALYRSSEFQERGQFNPAELTNEMSFNGTPLKCKRVRQLTIQIDNVEGRIENITANLKLQQIPQFIEKELNSQVGDFYALAHHIKILTHRFQQVLNQYPQNKKLKRKLHKKLRDVTRQTRLLWNSINIEQYKPKAQLFQFRKKEELQEMRKAA